ncbi:hypothetical protein GGI43DRAFT_362208 [Trichoderma evansii]
MREVPCSKISPRNVKASKTRWWLINVVAQCFITLALILSTQTHAQLTSGVFFSLSWTNMHMHEVVYVGMSANFSPIQPYPFLHFRRKKMT